LTGGETATETETEPQTETESQTESEQSSRPSTTSDGSNIITTALAGTAGAGVLLLGWLYKSLRSENESVEDVDTYGNKSVDEELDGESTDREDSNSADTDENGSDGDSTPSN